MTLTSVSPYRFWMWDAGGRRQRWSWQGPDGSSTWRWPQAAPAVSMSRADPSSVCCPAKPCSPSPSSWEHPRHKDQHLPCHRPKYLHSSCTWQWENIVSHEVWFFKRKNWHDMMGQTLFFTWVFVCPYRRGRALGVAWCHSLQGAWVEAPCRTHRIPHCAGHPPVHSGLGHTASPTLSPGPSFPGSLVAVLRTGQAADDSGPGNQSPGSCSHQLAWGKDSTEWDPILSDIPFRLEMIFWFKLTFQQE